MAHSSEIDGLPNLKMVDLSSSQTVKEPEGISQLIGDFFIPWSNRIFHFFHLNCTPVRTGHILP